MTEVEICTVSRSYEEVLAVEEERRALWSNKLEGLLTIIGSAVGLGNIWRYPYLCYRNGGGAFLLPYGISLVLIGVPTLLMELSIGQFSSRNIFSVWNMAPLIKGLGASCLAINVVMTSYYAVIISWAAHYLFSSMASSLPWSSCDNWWNSQNCCVELNNTGPVNCTSASEEYFFNRVLQNTEDSEGVMAWELVGCLALVWLVTFLVLIKGVLSLGKVVYVTTLLPYLLLTALLVKGVTMEGASDGILYYVTPNVNALAHSNTWKDAGTQIFFSLSLSHGPMISMASFNYFKNNLIRDSVAVAVINGLTSFYGGFAIFAVLGHISKVKGLPIDNVVDQGPGLAFVVYPEVLSQMPVPQLWSVLFFLMMITLGLSSLFAQAEVINSVFLDTLPPLRTSRARTALCRAFICFFLLLLGLLYVTKDGFRALSVVDHHLAGVPMLVCALFEVSTVAFIYGYKRYEDDVEMMLGRRLSLYFKGTLNFITPVLLVCVAIATIVQYEPPLIRGEILGQTGVKAGWLMVGLILSLIPVWFVGYYLKNGGWELIMNMKDPTDSWGPMLHKNRVGRYAPRNSEGVLNDAFEPDNVILGNEQLKNRKLSANNWVLENRF